MPLGDILFGRKKLKAPARDRLFSLTTAAVTLDISVGLKPSGVAALVYKPLSAGEFAQADANAEQLVKTVAESFGSTLERKKDSLGFQWLIVHDPDIEDQVTAVYALSNELTTNGFGGQLLAAAFRFDGGDHPVYWIYGFKTGTFWPFVPTGGQDRDNPRELQLKSQLERELPVEPDLSKWFGLFDAPI